LNPPDRATTLLTAPSQPSTPEKTSSYTCIALEAVLEVPVAAVLKSIPKCCFTSCLRLCPPPQALLTCPPSSLASTRF
jgi:hypothetical protein